MSRGLFITLEGGDGSGKTTQAPARAVAADRGRTVVRTREPGGTDVGVEIREIVLHHRGDIAPRAEALLYAADRAHHVATVVRPAIARGEVVIQDRYIDSSVAYQGAGGCSTTPSRALSEWATEGLAPDLTVLLDLEPGRARSPRRGANALRPARGRGIRVPRPRRSAYLALADGEPERFLVVDARCPSTRSPTRSVNASPGCSVRIACARAHASAAAGSVGS